MSYDNAKLEIGREHIYIVDLLLSYCSLTFSNSPCTASGTGDAKCYNTFDSCQDTANYSPASTLGHFRFYQSRSPAPIGLAGSLVSGIDPIPNLLNVSISPAKLDVSGGLGVRSSVTCTFTDHPYSDIGVDKYIDDRTYIASDKGSFWTKLRARNPNYQNRSLRVLSGDLENGVFDINNFETRYYVVDSMNVTDGKCTIVAKDPLKLAGSKKAQAPAPSNGLLQSAITSGAASLTLTPAGVGNSEYPVSGKVLIKSEVMSFTRAGDVLTFTSAQNNTLATEHRANDTVQLCLEYNGEQVNDIVKDFLIENELFDQYRDVFRFLQTNTFCNVHDNTPKSSQAAAMSMILERLDDDALRYTEGKNDLSRRVLDFYAALRGSKVAKIRRHARRHARGVYRALKNLKNDK